MSRRGGEAEMEAKISANSARPQRRDSPPKKRKPRLLPPPLFRHPSISTSSPFRHAAAEKEEGEEVDLMLLGQFKKKEEAREER